jgi:L-ascorbate metabolism protein UlaG (beta-lactamase superfamily)
VQIHASSNFVAEALDGRSVDVLYLGIGGLGARRENFREAYWHHVAQATSPQVIIPVHWDSFGKSLTEPLIPMSWPGDRLEVSKKFLANKCNGAKIQLRWQRPFETTLLFKS